MQVEINPDNGGACTHRHIGYYMRQEGSGKGPATVGTSEGWQLAGYERLSSRNRSALWS
jgi:hypothetical protein